MGDSVRAREAVIPLTSLRVFPERAGTLLLELIGTGTVGSTLSKMATTGEVQKADRGYGLPK